MKISLCMMLKNEGKTVRDAIERVSGLVDEIVIGIDKLTNDNTVSEVKKAIPKKIAYLLDYFTFDNNFSEIRNKLINHCHGDYVLVLDGHDIVDESSIIYLKKFKEQDDTSADVIDFVISENKQVGQTLFQQPRMFKPEIRYSFAIHNTINHDKNRIVMPQVVIHHCQPEERYQARKKQREEINIEGLLNELDNKKPRSYFYIAQTYYEQQNYGMAIKYWLMYLIHEQDFKAERYQACIYLYYCFYQTEDIKKAKMYLYQCFDEDPLRNEHLIFLGDLLFKEGEYESALAYYTMAENIKMPMRFLLIEKEFYTWLPIEKKLLCYLALNAVDNALEMIKIGKTIEPRLEIWQKTEDEILKRVHLSSKFSNGLIYVVASINSFIEPILNKLGERFAIRFESKFNPDNAKGADVIWCEWGDHNAIAISNFQTDAKKVLRIHSYEAYSDYINSIHFDAFDRIIFVANHTKQYLESRLFRNLEQSVIIPNGIDLTKFKFHGEENNKVAWLGNLKTGKGVQLLMFLAASFPYLEFHVGGKFFEPDMQELFEEHKTDNVYFHGWISDVNEFFQDKTYVLSTSVRESNHLSIMEGMACGCIPLVYNWVGADFLYGQTFSDTLSFKEIIKNNRSKSSKYRNFIEDNFNQIDSLNRIDYLVSTLIQEKRDED